METPTELILKVGGHHLRLVCAEKDGVLALYAKWPVGDAATDYRWDAENRCLFLTPAAVRHHDVAVDEQPEETFTRERRQYNHSTPLKVIHGGLYGRVGMRRPKDGPVEPVSEPSDSLDDPRKD